MIKPFILTERRRTFRSAALRPKKHSLKAAGHALEPMTGLLEQPLHDPGDVIAVSHVVAQSREAVGLAALFHLRKLFEIKFVILNGAPIVSCVVHGKTRRECSIRADDQPILPPAAAPMFTDTAHETFHVLQAGDGVDHFVTLSLLVNQPTEKSTHYRK